MSTLVAQTISNGTVSTSSANVISGSARAWCYFVNTSISGSYNVSSVTKNGTGDYTINFTNAMPNINYATQYTAGWDLTGQYTFQVAPVFNGITTGSVRVRSYGSDGSMADPNKNSVTIFSS